LFVRELEESGFVPIEITVDGVVVKSDGFDRLSPVWAQRFGDTFHERIDSLR
jgi:hypothetical protein